MGRVSWPVVPSHSLVGGKLPVVGTRIYDHLKQAVDKAVRIMSQWEVIIVSRVYPHHRSYSGFFLSVPRTFSHLHPRSSHPPLASHV